MLNAVQQSSNVPRIPKVAGYTSEELKAMQRAMLNLFDRWGVSDVNAAVILGGISAKTYRRWKDEDYGRVSRDLADRMSNLLGIHKLLRIVFANSTTGYDWINAPNNAFADKSALSILLQGGMEDILRIRRYLDAARGGW